jgi:predicted transcriptional regulator
MNFNVYLDDALGEALAHLAEHQKVSRNALIRKAVQALVERETHPPGWPVAVQDWQGVADFPAFESYRTGLKDPQSDPFA